VRSYDDPPQGPFDVVVAIESLAHSPDPGHTLSRLAAVMAPGGVIAVVDDMPLVDDTDADLQWFKRGWHCPVLFRAEAYRQALGARGLTLEHDVDLTPLCRPRSFMRLSQLAWLNRAVHRVVPSEALRTVMDSHMGGLALERLIRRHASEYRLLVARRAVLQVS
jgi:SAM-dependent methyltransferase